MVDLALLNKVTKGDKKKLKQYINLYLQVASETFEKMERNLTNQDWEQLRIHAHSLKPQMDYIGNSALKTALIDIEKAIIAGEVFEVHELFGRAYRLHESSARELTIIIGEF